MKMLKCGKHRKLMFGSQDAALEFMERIASHPSAQEYERPSRVYQDPACGWYHMTSKPERGSHVRSR